MKQREVDGEKVGLDPAVSTLTRREVEGEEARLDPVARALTRYEGEGEEDRLFPVDRTMTRYDVQGQAVCSMEAWTPREIRLAVETCLDSLGDRLPGTSEMLFLKPDLASERLGLVGSSTDLRILMPLVEALKARGYSHLVMGDAPAPIFRRAGVDPGRRLRVEHFAHHMGIQWLDLNRAPAVTVETPSGVIHVARVAFDATLINLPTIRTHPRAGLALGAWNLKGLVRTVDRARVRRHVYRNLLTLVDRIRPSITLVNGLVAMEGEGPFEGDPVRIGRLFWGADVLSVDLMVSRLLGYTAEEVTHLWVALREGILLPEAQIAVEKKYRVLRDLRRPAVRSAARRSGQLVAGWFRSSLEARAEQPGWQRIADLAHMRRHVDPRESHLHHLRRHPEQCGECRRCEVFCPAGLLREEIGLSEPHPRCIECLYCFQVCPRDGLSLEGEGGALLDRILQDRAAIEKL